MSVKQPPGRPGVQLAYANEKDHRRQLAEGVNRANQGHINCTLYVTLDPNADSTPVVDARISLQTHAGLQPQTAHAAAALASTYVVCSNGSLTVFHTNNAETDRTYTMVLVG